MVATQGGGPPPGPIRPSISDIIARAPWSNLEVHLNGLQARVETSIANSHDLRRRYREELLANDPQLAARIRRPSQSAMERARRLLQTGTVAAADGTVSAVPLLSGSKIQVGVVIVFNRGEIVDLVTRVFEHEMVNSTGSARAFFAELRKARSVSNLVSRAVMLFGERRLLLDEQADWRMIHGELIPHELRTGAGRPDQNLPPTFGLINDYIASQCFIAVSEGTGDLDILNAAVLLEPGEYLVIRSLTDTLTTFLEGDTETGQRRANFSDRDERLFREFIAAAGPQVAVVLVRAGFKPFLLECHSDRVEEAVALFMADSVWTRGIDPTGSAAVRGFPYHIDLADQVAGTLFKGSDFERYVESRLMSLGIDQGLFDIDARRTR
jgi:hypothetical protein